MKRQSDSPAASVMVLLRRQASWMTMPSWSLGCWICMSVEVTPSGYCGPLTFKPLRCQMKKTRENNRTIGKKSLCQYWSRQLSRWVQCYVWSSCGLNISIGGCCNLDQPWRLQSWAFWSCLLIVSSLKSLLGPWWRGVFPESKMLVSCHRTSNFGTKREEVITVLQRVILQSCSGWRKIMMGLNPLEIRLQLWTFSVSHLF